jgi:TetR/AcrR family transcriptional repressor of nem operon
VTTAAASAVPAELLAEIRDSSKLEEAHTSAEVGALQMLSEMIGALVLSRAVAAADPALSTEILAANRRKLDG